MGYRISTIKNLPIIPGINLYIFVLGNYEWSGGYREVIEKNFNKLAKNLGPHAAIVVGHDGINLANELITSLRDKLFHHKALERLAQEAESSGVALLLLGAHPKELKETDLILYAPISEIESKFNELDIFFNELCSFATNRNESFLKKFEEQKSSINDFLDVIDLKPNIFGIGSNINSFIKKVLRVQR
jgi:hypothetical protein